MYTLGDVAIVENVSTLTVTQAERGDSLSQLPPPAGQTAYTFLAVFLGRHDAGPDPDRRRLLQRDQLLAARRYGRGRLRRAQVHTHRR
jgi:hypothetical protein